MQLNIVPRFSQDKSDSDLTNEQYILGYKPMPKSEQRLSRPIIEEDEEQSRAIRRCLLVNDNDFLLKIFGYALEPHFAEIVKCFNGKMAVELVTSHPSNYFSVIILDINMPVMDGRDACIQITQHFRQVKENHKSFLKKKPSNEIIRTPSLHSNSLSERIQHPHIYALTGDMHQDEALDQMKKIGFKAVYHELNKQAIMEILDDANLSYHSYHSSRDSQNQEEEEKNVMGELDGYEDLEADEDNNSDHSISFSREENSPVSQQHIAIEEQFSSAVKQEVNDQENDNE